jgi:hypothetical protein
MKFGTVDLERMGEVMEIEDPWSSTWKVVTSLYKFPRFVHCLVSWTRYLVMLFTIK